MSATVDCPNCGGQCYTPAEDFGDTGLHPCYYCGTDGFVTKEQDYDRLKQEYDTYYNTTDGIIDLQKQQIAELQRNLTKQIFEVNRLHKLLTIHGIDSTVNHPDYERIPF